MTPFTAMLGWWRRWLPVTEHSYSIASDVHVRLGAGFAAAAHAVRIVHPRPYVRFSMPVPQDVQDHVAALDGALGDLPISCTVPLFVRQNGYTIPFATGTLLQIDGVSFLATAAHAVTDAAGIGSRLYVGGLKGAKVFSLYKDIIYASRGSSVDLAAWRLHPDDVPHFAEKRFLQLQDLWLYDAAPGSGPFVLYGYLADLRGAAGEDMPKGYVNSARLYMGRFDGPAPVELYDANEHLLFTGNALHMFREGGASAILPPSEYRGISGSAVFAVSMKGRLHAAVAIETCVQPGNIIQGTRISSLVELIGRKHEDIRQPVIEFLDQLPQRRP